MTWSSGEVEATTVMRESAFRVAEKPDLFFPFQISGVSGLARARDFGRPSLLMDLGLCAAVR